MSKLNSKSICSELCPVKASREETSRMKSFLIYHDDATIMFLNAVHKLLLKTSKGPTQLAEDDISTFSNITEICTLED